jgi:translation initiation factor IF-3
MSLNDALRLAYEKGMDLVEVAAQATPPVCRIVNYGKFLYEESKKESGGRQQAGRMKEIQISPTIDPHDLATKRNHAIQFLCDDMKVRIKLRFRGRQKAHKEVGFEVVNRFVREVAAYGVSDSPPKMLGDRDLSVTISPLPRNKRAHNPRETTEANRPPKAAAPPEPVEASQTSSADVGTG